MVAGLARYYGGSSQVMKADRPQEVRVDRRVHSDAAKIVQGLQVMPRRVSQAAVVNSAKIAKEMEIAAELAAKLAENQKRMMAAAVKQHEIAAKNQKEAMQAALKVDGINAEFAMQLMQFGLNREEIKHEVKGMQAAYEGAKTIFN